MKRLKLEGKKFGNWTVMSYADTKGWMCVCLCGKVSKVTTQNLTNKKSTQCHECAHRLPEGEAVFNDLYARYKQSAKQRQVEFDLSKPLVRLLFLLPCNYCGQPPSQIWQRLKIGLSGTIVYNGIDRRDSAVGYISTNVVPCCKRCNIAKREATEVEFIDHAKKIVAYQEAM